MTTKKVALFAALILVSFMAGCAAAQPAPTPYPRACCGDCNGDGVVLASEAGRSNGIRHGTQPLSSCPPADCDGSGSVSPAEFDTATANSVQGCPCCGDCNGNGAVLASEVAKANAIRFGTQSLSLCPTADCDVNGVVTQSEVNAAIQNSLSGCPR